MKSNYAQKNSLLADAYKHFPKKVFQEWLKLRRQGADTFFPEWRTLEKSQRRAALLDNAARLKALFN